ncbi:ATP-binding protein [Massilia norwichensis]|uniref:histidine kinase n=1 Tax=Massilia norwichensis TaxID=1442366 RepID=A0ABT2A1U9_9BURK|nr:ATP-binding protein [Massilia norwichensis]MCS0588164.1 ATP-binding protein [Massilia norwichensis]
MPEAALEYRILIHAPVGKDARLIAELFGRAGIDCGVCAQLDQLMEELGRGAGALLVADEAITPEFLRAVGHFVEHQQGWSDLPVLVMSRREAASPGLQHRYLELGNVSLLERPAQGVTLVSAAQSALRARRRQYAMREVDQRKDEFLAMLGHELRNPLAPIRAASDLLRLPSLGPERIQQTSEIISRQVKHMTGLIDDLLDLSRVSRGLVTLDETLLDARQIVTAAVEQVRPLVDARRHRVTIQMPGEAAFVHGDQKRLVQIVANVLNNAAKYTPEGGEIGVALFADEDTVSYVVSDNGIGMAPHMIEHVFDMFAQAERSSDRSQGGLGIGLALVRNLVALHGGRVAAYSEGIGKGSRFTVTLPRVEDAAREAAPAAHGLAPAQAQTLHLLVVDDNEDAGQMLGMYLEMAGYRVTVVQSARAALDAVRADTPDVCLLDIGLPDIDGNELARQLRQMPHMASATLIAITGYGQEADRARTAAAGFDHHFVKPVDMQALLAVLAGEGGLGEPTLPHLP